MGLLWIMVDVCERARDVIPYIHCPQCCLEAFRNSGLLCVCRSCHSYTTRSLFIRPDTNGARAAHTKQSLKTHIPTTSEKSISFSSIPLQETCFTATRPLITTATTKNYSAPARFPKKKCSQNVISAAKCDISQLIGSRGEGSRARTNYSTWYLNNFEEICADCLHASSESDILLHASVWWRSRRWIEMFRESCTWSAAISLECVQIDTFGWSCVFLGFLCRALAHAHACLSAESCTRSPPVPIHAWHGKKVKSILMKDSRRTCTAHIRGTTTSLTFLCCLSPQLKSTARYRLCACVWVHETTVLWEIV